jgi:hypothetical protein
MKYRKLLLSFIALSFLHLSCENGENDELLPTNPDDLVLLAWNDLGMHCLNPTYDQLVILPPYNNVMAQVVSKGNPPEIITTGITVEYNMVNNTSSSDKRAYGGFWEYAQKLFGMKPADDTGLTGAGLSGIMDVKDGYFIVEGIPVTPVDDDGNWDPYQMIELKVKDVSGNIVASTRATVPTSDEINCAKCHGDGTLSSAFEDILQKHDDEASTTLISGKPVLCASCHGSPALGTSGPGSSGKYLSQAIHGSHAERGASCYDCHPGQNTSCNRSTAHTAADGNCTTCHGSMANVANSIEQGRVPWENEPTCVSCHSGVADVDTHETLYRNARGHGDLYCSACHGSPHAMIPSNEEKDNYQAMQYQGQTRRVKTIGSCGVCHNSSRGEDEDEFGEEHGGSNPEKKTTCHVCHTVVPTKRGDWPHAFTWNNSN